jgi:hypothetical protein
MLQNNDFVSAEELAKREFNTLRGKICSFIESMGMPHSQERAAVTLIKQYTYESQDVISQLVDSCEDIKFRYNETRVENNEQ